MEKEVYPVIINLQKKEFWGKKEREELIISFQNKTPNNFQFEDF